MSMLSAQCDELRTMAASVGLAMPQAATLMMEAADTITELRESVHRERAEADKLRELVARMAEALGIDSEWADVNWCKRPCALEFGCWPEDMDIRCPAWAAMQELGIEADA